MARHRVRHHKDIVAIYTAEGAPSERTLARLQKLGGAAHEPLRLPIGHPLREFRQLASSVSETLLLAASAMAREVGAALHAPGLADPPEMCLEAILRKRAPKVEVVEEWRNITAGDLLVNHGHEVGRGSGGQHPARDWY